MKKLQFETSKGVFFMVDAIERKNLQNGIFLKQITEEQASEIVDNPINGNFYPKYGDFEGGNMWYCLVNKPI